MTSINSEKNELRRPRSLGSRRRRSGNEHYEDHIPPTRKTKAGLKRNNADQIDRKAKKRDIVQTLLANKAHDHDYTGVPTNVYDDEVSEKPWQRVPSTLLIVVLGVYLLFGYFTQLVEDDMPSVVQDSMLTRDNSDTFSEETAVRYLLHIVGDQPRVAGTKFHLQKTQDMKALVDGIAAAATLPVTTDWQMVTGDYYLNTSTPFFNYYQNCSNIIALLEGESGFHSNGTLASSILVNCHYDSVPYAMGASDNAVFCAVMAESLAKLSKRQNKFKHNVIFLFNGAEENPLQASHAFLQHPWAKGVISVINLDAAGMNGKPTVFQVSDPRLLKSYSRTARRPTAQALAEFLFKSGIIPSDTDFRIFRDFGDIHGIDIAFTKMAHVYHTRNDRPDLVKPGVIQNAGDMMLALIADIADVETMDHKVEPSAALYLDYLNVFMVTYSLLASYAVDALIAVLALATVAYYLWLVGARQSSVRELLFAALSRVVAMLAGIVVAAICVLLMVATTIQMRYLSHAWLVVPLYWLPYVIPAVAASQLFDAWRLKKSGLSRSLRTLQAMAATRLILAVITILLLCIPAVNTMRYLITIPLFIMSLTAVISITVVRYLRLTGWQHLLMEVLLSLPTVMWMFSLVLRLDAMMLPIMGRSSNDTPDYTVGILNIGMAILVVTPVSGIELLFSRKRLWMVLSAVGAVCFVLMFIPFSPYEDDGIAVQRHYWFHSQITSYDVNGNLVAQKSGVLVVKMDPYTLDYVTPALTKTGYSVNVRRDWGDDCEKYIYCDMPAYRTSFAKTYQNGMFMSTGPPAAFNPAPTFTVESRSCAGNTCTYTFVMTGEAHNMVTFWPYANITVSSWSLQTPVTSSFTQLGRPVYVLFHSTPTYMEQWSARFTLVFNVPQSLQSGPIVEVSHHSHKLYHPEDYTAEYRTIVEAMPKFFNIATIQSFRNNYVF